MFTNVGALQAQTILLSRLIDERREGLIRERIGENKRWLYTIARHEETNGLYRCRLVNQDGEVVVTWREGVEYAFGRAAPRIVFDVLITKDAA